MELNLTVHPPGIGKIGVLKTFLQDFVERKLAFVEEKSALVGFAGVVVGMACDADATVLFHKL
jgi:hypothetical protein